MVRCDFFLGINVIADEIQRDPSKVKLIKDRGQVLFCWTDDQNNPAIVQVWTLDTDIQIKKVS